MAPRASDTARRGDGKAPEFADGSPSTLVAGLRWLREQRLFCDAVLTTESSDPCDQLSAHQVVLAAASESLQQYLVGDSEETKNTPGAGSLQLAPAPVELKIQGISDVEALRVTLGRIYGDSDEQAVSSSESNAAAQKLLATGLRLSSEHKAGSASAAASVARGLRALRMRGAFCDIALVVGGCRYEAHQAVLAAASEGARRYLNEALDEIRGQAAKAVEGAIVSQPLELELEGVTNPEAILVMLDHIYGVDKDGNYQPNSEAVNRDVLRIAIGFGLPLLKERATQWLIVGVTEDNLKERLATCEEFEFKALRETIEQAAAALPPSQRESLQESGAEAEEEIEVAPPPAEEPVEAPDLAAALRAMQQMCFHTLEGVPDETVDGFPWPNERQDLKVLGRLMETFEKRPCYTLGSIKAQLPASVDKDTVKRLLPYVAYQWVDGPWKGSYCRLGWDPREDSEVAASLQVFVFRDPYLRNNNSPKPDEDEVEDCFFRRPPTKLPQVYQLEDIKDKFISDLIESAEAESECLEKTGWLSDIILEAVKGRLSFKSHQMREKIMAVETKSRAPDKTSASAAKRRKVTGGC